MNSLFARHDAFVLVIWHMKNDEFALRPFAMDAGRIVRIVLTCACLVCCATGWPDGTFAGGDYLFGFYVPTMDQQMNCQAAYVGCFLSVACFIEPKPGADVPS